MMKVDLSDGTGAGVVRLFLIDYPIRIKSMPIGYDGVPILQGCGSSECLDYEGDIVQLSCLQDLCADIDTFSNCFIDHQIDTAHLLGSLAERPSLETGYTKDGKPYAKVEIGVGVFMDNPLAVMTLKAVEGRATRRTPEIGYSVGMLVTEYDLLKDASGKPTGGVEFLHGQRREFSSTPMPANPTTWITGIVKTLRSQGVLPSDDNILELKHVARHWHEHSPMDVARLMRLSKSLTERAVDLSTAGFLQDKRYEDLTGTERDALASQIRESLLTVAA